MMKQKLLTLFLALAASVAPLFAQSGTCGDNLTWTLSGGTLTISGTGAMTNYLSYSNVPWYSYRSSITSVIIGNGVTSIGNYAFYNCSSLTSITVPSSVTSIGHYAFSSCSKLTSIEIPSSVTSIGSTAFQNCYSLTSVTINSNRIMSSTYSNLKNVFGEQVKQYIIGDDVKSIGSYAFSGCSSLTSATIGNSVTSIGDRAFSDCRNLTSIAIPNSVTSIGNGAFSGCWHLTSVTIPNSVTSIGDGAFEDCWDLTSATIGNSVTRIGNSAFSGCSKLTSITIPNSVTSIGNSAFTGCWSLTDITIPNSVTSIGDNAFSNCSDLTSITIGNSVTIIGSDAFSSGSKLTTINVDAANSAYCDIDGVLFSKDKTTLVRYPAGKTAISYTIPNSVTNIGNSAFGSCRSLTSIEIPSSVTTIGNSAFGSCSNLTSITIPNSVTTIGNDAFSYCSKLTTVHISDLAAWCKIVFSDYDANPLYYAHNLYLNGTLITDLVIPDGVTSIGNYAFSTCSSLTSVTIPNSVTSIGYSAFKDCSGLTSVTIGNSITSIGNHTFADCNNIITVTISAETPPSASSSSFNGLAPSDITLYVPTQWIPLYKYDAVWKQFNIQGIDATYLTYTVTWKNYDGSVLETDENVAAGTIPTYNGATPTKPADEDNTYTFSGWTPAVVTVAGNASYTATFQSVQFVTFTITWQDEDGNVIKTDEVAQGTTPAFTGTAPTKPATNEYTYEFAGWLPKIKPATEDVRYTTYFERNKIETPVYTVNINGENCSLNINNQYPEGTVITLEAVADECFEFQQWSDGNKDNPRTITVTANTNLTAEFNKVRYTVTGQPSTGGKVQIRKQ